jgi:hypothetical protein
MANDSVSDQMRAQPAGARGGHGRGLLTLWFVVTALWTAATVLRIDRIWVPGLGWPAVLAHPFTWVSLLLPPAVFGGMLFAAARYLARADRF